MASDETTGAAIMGKTLLYISENVCSTLRIISNAHISLSNHSLKSESNETNDQENQHISPKLSHLSAYHSSAAILWKTSCLGGISDNLGVRIIWSIAYLHSRPISSHTIHWQKESEEANEQERDMLPERQLRPPAQRSCGMWKTSWYDWERVYHGDSYMDNGQTSVRPFIDKTNLRRPINKNMIFYPNDNW